MRLLETNVGLGAADWATVRSAIPRTEATTAATLFDMFGSTSGDSIEERVAVLVYTPGFNWVTTIVCVTAALFVSAPMLNVTNPVFVRKLPAEVEIGPRNMLVGN